MVWGVPGKCTNVYTMKQIVINAKSQGLQDHKGWRSRIQLGDQETLPKKESLHWTLKGGKDFGQGQDGDNLLGKDGQRTSSGRRTQGGNGQRRQAGPDCLAFTPV